VNLLRGGLVGTSSWDGGVRLEVLDLLSKEESRVLGVEVH